MRKTFLLSHLDGAPLLTPDSTEESPRHLGESINLLDVEPVIVVNLDHIPFVDCVGACLELLFAKKPDTAIIVIDQTHSMNIPSGRESPGGITVVDSIAAAAILARARALDS